MLRSGIFNLTFIVILLVTPLFLSSCGSGSKTAPSSVEGMVLTQKTDYLRMTQLEGGEILVDISNPWKECDYLGRFVLLSDSCSNKLEYNGYERINVPIKNSLVYSSVHALPLVELGCADFIAGIADATYFTNDEIRSKLAEGKITDVGNAMSPSLEKIIELSPDIAIVSPYENSGHGVLDKTGITVVDCVDYMETHPLGRAEWMLLFGALTGRLEDAQSIYDEVSKNYSELSDKALKTRTFPMVLAELPFSGVWYQPGGRSYMAQLIRDAGGKPVYDDDKTVGSLQLDVANVIDKGSEADAWIIKATSPLSYDDIQKEVRSAGMFKSFRNHNVWYVNSYNSDFYDVLAFHPDVILNDYIQILHPEIESLDEMRFFKKVSD